MFFYPFTISLHLTTSMLISVSSCHRRRQQAGICERNHYSRQRHQARAAEASHCQLQRLLCERQSVRCEQRLHVHSRRWRGHQGVGSSRRGDDDRREGESVHFLRVCIWQIWSGQRHPTEHAFDLRD